MSHGLKNNLNIGFSIVLMIVMGVLIIKGLLANHQTTAGSIESFECANTRKSQSSYQYDVKLKDGQTFRNLFDVPCEVMPKISNGDYVQIESIGHQFVQITLNGVDLFDKSSLERRGNTVNFVFVLLFLLGLFDFSFRVYIKVKSKGSTVV